MDELHYNRTRDEFLGTRTFNATYYANLDLVKKRIRTHLGRRTEISPVFVGAAELDMWPDAPVKKEVTITIVTMAYQFGKFPKQAGYLTDLFIES